MKATPTRMSVRFPDWLLSALETEARSLRVSPLDSYIRWKLLANLPYPVLGDSGNRGQTIVARTLRMSSADLSVIENAARIAGLNRHAFVLRVLAGPAPMVVWPKTRGTMGGGAGTDEEMSP